MSDQLSWKRYLLKETDAKDIYINDKPRYATFTYPGIVRSNWSLERPDVDLSSFDLTKVSALCEDCDEFVTLHRPSHSWDRNIGRLEEIKSQNAVVFMNCTEFRMSRSLYDPRVLLWPLKVKVSHGCRSGPHVTNQVELMTIGNECPLVIKRACASFVDAKTHALLACPPPIYTDNLDGKETLSEGLRVKRLPQRPTDTYTRRVLILLSDCDWNNHANDRIYLSKCIQTLHHAVSSKEWRASVTAKRKQNGSLSTSGLYKTTPGDISDSRETCHPRWITPDVLRRGVKTARMKYIGQSFAGEELCVHLWQDQDKPSWVFFSLESEDSSKPQVRFEMSLEYYDPPSKL